MQTPTSTSRLFSRLSVSTSFFNGQSLRYRSNTKLFKPSPRSYKRRLYEKTLRPVPFLGKFSLAARCSKRDEVRIPWERRQLEPNALDMAHVAFIREYLADKRVVAICQGLPVDARSQNFNIGAMRVKGVETQSFPPRTLNFLVQDTRLAGLKPLFCTDNTYLLSATDPNKLKNIVAFTNRFAWLELLVCVVDDKILSAEETKQLAMLPSLELLPSQTVSLLASVPVATTQLLHMVPRTLVALLDSFVQRNKDHDTSSGSDC